MKGVLCLVFAIVCCASSIVASRLYFAEEDDIDYKRFQLLKTKSGDEEVIDLLSDEVTAFAVVTDVTYYLYTKHNLEIPHTVKSSNIQELSISPHFDPAKKTFFIIHGWVDDYTADVNRLVKAALLSKHDLNVIVVDWSPVASESYTTAQNAVTAIGKFVGDFINDMMTTYGISGSQVAIVGHSLGAHIAGNAGSIIRSKVDQIIGLDPAAPMFTVDNTENRLDPTDAQYVQVIHTNGRFLGFSSSIGDADYYPNGGMIQAGCGIDLLGGCSHARAFEYLAEAIGNGGKFTATLCGSYSDYQNKKCTNNAKSNMGSATVDKR
jgi:pancreatic triacylglycerol lipase